MGEPATIDIPSSGSLGSPRAGSSDHGEASTISKQARVVKATVKPMTVGLRGCLGGLFTATFSLRSIRSNYPWRLPRAACPFSPSYSLTVQRPLLSYLPKTEMCLQPPLIWRHIRRKVSFLDLTMSVGMNLSCCAEFAERGQTFSYILRHFPCSLLKDAKNTCIKKKYLKNYLWNINLISTK